MSIFKFEFAHTIKQIWVIGEVMPEETSALGQLYDTLGVFGVVQANEVMPQNGRAGNGGYGPAHPAVAAG